MNNYTYLFYDIESTGLNPCFDQVLQFAAIRTDTNLNEVERYEFRFTLNSDIIPAPMAILTHQQPISSMLCSKNENEYTGLQKIHALFNTPNTITLGYNTLGFDDEFLRFSFYRNLLPPYTHQFKHNCYRMDIYPMTILYYLFKPDIIKWPSIDNRISLRLENLNAENSLAKGMAHDAMVDVIATVELAKRFKKDEKMWQYCCGYFKKSTDLNRLSQLDTLITINNHTYPLAYLLQGKLGSKNNYICPVLGLGTHSVYKNQTLWLRLDQPLLDQTNSTNIEKNTYVMRKKTAENSLILPYLDRYQTHINPERTNITINNINWLSSNPQVFPDITEYHKNYTYPTVPDVDVDAALYQTPFTNYEQEKQLQAFHDAAPSNKLDAALQIHHNTYRELALRILFKHYPEHLTEEHLQEHQHHLQQIYNTDEKTQSPKDYRNQHKLNALTALNEIAQIKKSKTLNDNDNTLLTELSNMITNKQDHLQSDAIKST